MDDFSQHWLDLQQRASRELERFQHSFPDETAEMEILGALVALFCRRPMPLTDAEVTRHEAALSGIIATIAHSRSTVELNRSGQPPFWDGTDPLRF